ASLVGVVLNLFAVPWVTLLVVPALLLAILFAAVPLLGDALFAVAGWAMDLLWWVALETATWPGAAWSLPEPTPLILLLAFAGVAVLLLPRGVPGKPLALLLL